MLDIGAVLLIIATLLVVISVIQPLAARLKLPHSVLLAAVGVAIGAAAAFLLYTPLTNAFNEIVEPIVNLPFRSSTFIYAFLPILLFQAALTINVRRMAEDAAPILLLAVVAVLVATAFIGLGLSMLTTVSLTACLLVGSIVATTDPAAVVAIFRDIGAPGRLTRLVEGESLLNDAAAIALFGVLLEVLVSRTEPDVVAAAATFAVAFAGGIVLGLVAGRVTAWTLRRLRGLQTAEITLVLAMPYIAFIVAERLLAVSGVVAVVTAGLTLSAVGRTRVSPSSWSHIETVLAQVAFWAGSLVFILASILVPRLLGGVTLHDLLLLAVVVVAALLARAAVLFLLLPALSAMRLSQTVNWQYKTVILWGGMRGAVTLALALAITENRELPADVKEFVAILATGFVLFTLFVNGTTLRPLIRLLGLDRLSPLHLALRRQVLALALGEVRDSVTETARDYQIAPPLARSVARRYEDRVADVMAGGSLEDSVPDRDRFTIGLIALANRERELVLEHHGHRTVSQPVVETLMRNAGRLIDGARMDGRTGYMRAARQVLHYPMSFRFGHYLQRWLRITRPLVKAVADRFELLMVRRLLIEELRRFNQRRLRPVLGQRVQELLAEVLESRLSNTARALDALRLQYPEYAEALEKRFLLRFALRRENMEYETLFREGMIDQELFESLRRDLHAAEQEADRRPPLDLNLRTEDLVRQSDMFRNLDERQLRQVSRLLTPRFIVPDELIIRKGERDRTIYFIANGAVEVHRGDLRVRLGRGDFFGEMAAFAGRPRESDVVALTFGQLLSLRVGDLRRFLRDHPDIKARIDAVMAAREQMNRQADGSAA